MEAVLNFNSSVKIATISDMHLSSRDSRTVSAFFNDKKLSSFLRKVTSKVDLLVLNGDILELLHPKIFPFSYLSEFRKVKHTYPLTLEEISKNQKIFYIRGNHDPKVWIPYKRTYDKIRLVNPGGELLFTHGHDGINKIKAFEIVDYFVGWSRRILGYTKSKIIENFVEDKIENTFLSNGNISRFVKKSVIRHYENPELKGIVYGHLHLPFNIDFNIENVFGRVIVSPDFRSEDDITYIYFYNNGGIYVKNYNYPMSVTCLKKV